MCVCGLDRQIALSDCAEGWSDIECFTEAQSSFSVAQPVPLWMSL